MKAEEKRHWDTHVGGKRPYKAIPQETVFRSGTMKPHKGLIDHKDPLTGKVKEIAYFSWDADVPCSHRACPAFASCPFDVKSGTEGDCAVMTHYMKAIQAVVLGEISHKLTTSQLYRFGMQLLPLYRGLARMKIVEMGVRNLMIEGMKGGLTVHPIYREIRESIKLIEVLWRSIGLHEADFILPELLTLFQKHNKGAIGEDGKLLVPTLAMAGSNQVHKTYYELMEEELEGSGTGGVRRYVNPSLQSDGKPKLKLRSNGGE